MRKTYYFSGLDAYDIIRLLGNLDNGETDECDLATKRNGDSLIKAALRRDNGNYRVCIDVCLEEMGRYFKCDIEEIVFSDENTFTAPEGKFGSSGFADWFERLMLRYTLMLEYRNEMIQKLNDEIMECDDKSWRCDKEIHELYRKMDVENCDFTELEDRLNELEDQSSELEDEINNLLTELRIDFGSNYDEEWCHDR